MAETAAADSTDFQLAPDFAPFFQRAKTEIGAAKDWNAAFSRILAPEIGLVFTEFDETARLALFKSREWDAIVELLGDRARED